MPVVPPHTSTSHCPTCSCVPQTAGDHRSDPRWRLAQAQADSRYPELPSSAQMAGISRAYEVALAYEIGFPLVQLPSFPPNGWLPALENLDRCDPGVPVRWDPDRHTDIRLGVWHRLIYYRLLVNIGACETTRDAVKRLASARRDWRRGEITRHAEYLRDRHANRARVGAQRHLKHLRDKVMAAGGPCTYCGDPRPTSVDHMIPRSRGGPDSPQNLTICCWPCNAEKARRTPDEWKATRLAAGLPWPPPPRSVSARKAS